MPNIVAIASEFCPRRLGGISVTLLCRECSNLADISCDRCDMVKKIEIGPPTGYARVSTKGQDLAWQRGTLREDGCTRIFKEKVSGTKRDRPELGRLLEHLHAGGIMTVTRLDRLARSKRNLLDIAERIKDTVARLRSLAEPWADKTTLAGHMVLIVLAGMADFERSLIVERTSAGQLPAKARGARFGPTPTLDVGSIVRARQLIEQDGKPVTEVARLLGVHRATLYRALER